MTDHSTTSNLSIISPAQYQRLRRMRRAKEWLARSGIMLGGVGVIAAVALIFFYLLYEVAPLFAPAHAERVGDYTLAADIAGGGDTLAFSVEEQNEVAFRLSAAGDLVFFGARNGALREHQRLPHAEVSPIVTVATGGPGGDTLAVGFADGAVIVLRKTYAMNFAPDGSRSIDPAIEYPFGEEPIHLFGNKAPTHLAVTAGSTLQLVARAADGEMATVRINAHENFMTGEVIVEEEGRSSTTVTGDLQTMWLGRDGLTLFLNYRDGRVAALETADLNRPGSEWRLPAGRTLTASAMLLGNLSLLVGDDSGRISQLFVVRDAQNQYHLKFVRELQYGDAPIRHILPEQRRKSLVAIDDAGRIGLLNTTSTKVSLVIDSGISDIRGVAVAPRGNGLLLATPRGITRYGIENEHPDVSLSALWSKVWYEGYDEPKYIWQSSAATADFEPKYSLSPLVFGTLKAAFFAMLLAIPLAVCGAIYTAYFMSPTLRKSVKPTIELMEALPTVILGFLAGLWLAPMVENSLPGIFTMLLLLPVLAVAAAWGWYNLPDRVRLAIPTGWEPILLVPIIAIGIAVPMLASGWMETTFFGGDMRLWLRDVMGIPFDQRNALIIGFAMGFAVIPTIYSIAEDALFEVPKHLTQGSLALGATPWQTVVRVVLPTASPGIFSAVMMGFGRAVGETMIVLMATGNTPVMTMNIFEGMRTLSANIAVEMPESEVGSSHFRILFLAALVLFIFTFIVNTSAELVRQRLRKKYGTL